MLIKLYLKIYDPIQHMVYVICVNEYFFNDLFDLHKIIISLSQKSTIFHFNSTTCILIDKRMSMINQPIFK